MKNGTLNNLVSNTNPTIMGFPAFQGLTQYSNGSTEIVISTLSPAIMLSKGYSDYYAPIIPRDSRFESAEEVYSADLGVNKVSVGAVEDLTEKDEVVIASRHQATVDILKGMFPHSKVLGAVTPEDIRGKNVVGSLPPALVQHCAVYKAVMIANYDASVDGDLAGDALAERLIVADSISVEVEEAGDLAIGS